MNTEQAEPMAECIQCGKQYPHECEAEYAAWWETAAFCTHLCPDCSTATENGESQ